MAYVDNLSGPSDIELAIRRGASRLFGGPGGGGHIPELNKPPETFGMRPPPGYSKTPPPPAPSSPPLGYRLRQAGNTLSNAAGRAYDATVDFTSRNIVEPVANAVNGSRLPPALGGVDTAGSQPQNLASQAPRGDQITRSPQMRTSQAMPASLAAVPPDQGMAPSTQPSRRALVNEFKDGKLPYWAIPIYKGGVLDYSPMQLADRSRLESEGVDLSAYDAARQEAQGRLMEQFITNRINNAEAAGNIQAAISGLGALSVPADLTRQFISNQGALDLEAARGRNAMEAAEMSKEKGPEYGTTTMELPGIGIDGEPVKIVTQTINGVPQPSPQALPILATQARKTAESALNQDNSGLIDWLFKPNPTQTEIGLRARQEFERAAPLANLPPLPEGVMIGPNGHLQDTQGRLVRFNAKTGEFEVNVP
jgi:hypothetical protein